MDNIVVIDDSISKGYQNIVENFLGSDDFSWYFSSNITEVGGKETISGFSDNLYQLEENIKKPGADLLIPILYESVDKYEKDRQIKELFRIRVGMFVKDQTDKPHQAHVDSPDLHYTMLYYVNDSDGPTNIFDYKGEKVIQEIEPKKGRAVIMTGDTYHSSSCPRNHINRIVVNYNFLV